MTHYRQKIVNITVKDNATDTMIEELETDDAERVFGYPDCLKLRSCMTLFAEAVPDDEVFQKVLDKFYTADNGSRTRSIIRNPL